MRRSEESATKLDGDRLRAEMATLTGRRNSLQALIREHSYSTDTVRKLLKSNSLLRRPGPGGHAGGLSRSQRRIRNRG